MSFQRPDPHRYRLAALKSAYLGACLLLGEIPESPDADEIRTEILAARDLGPGSDPTSANGQRGCSSAGPRDPRSPARWRLWKLNHSADSLGWRFLSPEPCW